MKKRILINGDLGSLGQAQAGRFRDDGWAA